MDETLQTEVQTINKIYDVGIELALGYGPKLLLAIVVLFLGIWLIKGVLKVLDKALESSKVEPTLRKFLGSICSAILKIMLLIVFASMIGVETASLIAVLGAAGLAIGLALQGSLANFAGGVLILLFKPFKVNDVIEAQGFVGRVVEIQIFNTILRTLDNQKIIIPNGVLSNNSVKNLFCEATRRVDLTFGVAYKDDIDKVRATIQSVLDQESRILTDLGVEIYVSAHADSSINFLTRVWVNSDDYWGVHFNLIEQVKKAFDKNGITIPFPQRDVYVFNQNS
jgi:small conductance mechanosensitive channel